MLAIITDSTCDLPADELRDLHIRRVPLYVNFRGEVLKDWLEITPGDIVAGVSAGAAIPSTSQPSPQDFINAFQAAVTQGATEILCITISSKLSGTYRVLIMIKNGSKWIRTTTIRKINEFFGILMIR